MTIDPQGLAAAEAPVTGAVDVEPTGAEKAEPTASGGWRAGTFALILVGQVVSLFGSALTTFGLGVWVFRETGSVTQFGLISLFAVLPAAVLSPLAGALVDRWDRRWTLVASDSLAGLATLFILAMALTGRLAVWHVWVAALAGSVSGAFQYPAFTATTPLLVPKRHLARASAMQQTGASAGTIFAPMLGGVMLVGVGLEWIIAVDLVTFVFAVVTLLAVRIPRPPTSAAGRAGAGSLYREAAYGWRYIRDRPGFMALLALFAAFNFASGLVQVLVTPLVLSFTTAEVLGRVLTVGSVGPLVGAAVMSVWGGPKRRIHGIFGALALAGATLLLGGLEPSATLVAAAVFLFLFSFPVMISCSQAIWQAKVEPDLQGRVFAMRRMLAMGMMPVAFAVGGPLADHVFEPLLVPGGALAGTVGRWLGVGPGRGIGLMIVLMGGVILAAVAIASRYPRLTRLEEEIPDAIDDEPPPDPALDATSGGA